MSRLYAAIRRLLFLFPAEFVHRAVIAVLRRLPRPEAAPRAVPATIGGVGLAAGFIKNPEDLGAVERLGFDFAEVGTLTRYAQDGNPRPRLFRLPDDRAVVNRMGFNNPGLHAAERALRRPSSLVVGVNVGKGKRTPAGRLEAELSEAVALLTPYADFFVVNLSSPNTPGLRALLDPALLGGVLDRLGEARRTAARFWSRPVPPLLLKLHPDLDSEAWRAMLTWLPSAAIDGVVMSNTTVSRDGLASTAEAVAACGAGGLSGNPLWPRLERALPEIRAALPAERTLIAAGGIDSPERGRRARELGADAIEIYTGFIYGGPPLVARLRAALRS